MRNYTQLTLEQRYHISALIKTGCSVTYIAAELGVNKSTISRELRRNGNRHGAYYPSQADKRARKSKRGRVRSRIDPDTWVNVECCLCLDMSPEQTHLYLKNNGYQTVSHEHIYQYIRADRKAGGDLYKHLRGRPRHKKTYGSGRDRRGKISLPSIEARPSVVDERSCIGDWEADTIIGKGSNQAIVTLVERKSRFTLMEKVNGKTADEVAKAIISLLKPLVLYALTITVDNGKEFAGYKKIAKELGVNLYFAHPYHAWERGTNENTNGLIRQYVPKNMNISDVTADHLTFVMHRLNNRPRKVLGIQTPNQVFFKHGTVALTT